MKKKIKYKLTGNSIEKSGPNFSKTPIAEHEGGREHYEGNELLVFSDNFTIKTTGDLIETKHIKTIELPQLLINSLNIGNLTEEKTELILTLFDIDNCCKNLLLLTKKHFFTLKLTLKEDRVRGANGEIGFGVLKKNTTRSTWIFTDAHITALDFGELTVGLRSHPREVLCKLSYENLIIDGVKI